MSISMCKHRVYGGSRYSSINGRSCSNPAIDGKDYCKVHSPEATAKRQQAAQERHDDKVRQRNRIASSMAQVHRRASAYPAMKALLLKLIEVHSNCNAGPAIDERARRFSQIAIEARELLDKQNDL